MIGSERTPPGRAAVPLVVRFGAMGDLVQLTVLLELLRRRWGSPCDLVCSFPGARDLLSGLACVREIVLLDSRRTPYWLDRSQRDLVSWLRARGRSPAWLYEPAPGPARKLRWLLVRGGVRATDVTSAEMMPRLLLEHTIDYLRRLAATDPEGYAAPDPSQPVDPDVLPTLHLDPTEVEDGRRWLTARGWRQGPFTVLHPVSRRKERGRWPDSRWVAAIRGILESAADARVVLSGTAGERPELARIAAAANDPRVIQGAGELPLRRLIALLSLAQSAVCLDSGVAHLASAVGCPVAVLAGTADPRRVRPLGRAPVEILSSLAPEEWPDSPFEWRRRNRLSEIPAELVLAAWKRTARRDPL